MSGVPGSNDTVLGMSDEDFANLNGPPEADTTAPAEPVVAAEAPAAEAGDTENTSGTTGSDTGAETSETETGSVPEEPSAEDGAGDGSPAPAPAEGEKSGAAAVDTAAPGDKPDGEEAAAPAAAETAPDYAAIGQEILKPFKANGRDVQVKDAAEATRLMQMGANYTRKMQELQPHRKMLMMLQTNGLDEAKLDYLIALDKRDPEAIKKLIKDSGIDPLEIDTTVEPSFQAGSHQLTDSEVRFRTTVEELNASEGGNATIVEINTRFDEESKEALWQSPEIFNVIHEHRQSGVYGQIVEAMDRKITLGEIPPGTPFLQAYKTTGDELFAAPQPGGQGQQQPVNTGQVGRPAPAVVATRAAAPRPALANGAQASAASPSRSTTSAKAPVVNPLAMSDDDFLKQMGGRV